MTEEEKIIKDLKKDKDYSSDQFDKQLIYLSSGALILTIGFVKDLVNITDETNTTLLIISWASFSASLISLLLSFRTSATTMDLAIRGKRKGIVRWNALTKTLNTSAALFLIIGIILFIIFISKNI
jgi:hypothetical protein